jgi:UDP-2,3-diacylglucosamine pyrophosphatase LpxH
MHAMDVSSPPTGLVISDLHLFSGRSNGEACLGAIRKRIRAATVIVLNGDTFDFRWSTHYDENASILAAMEWLENFVADHPQAVIHLILGNHDCLAAFTARLEEFAASESRFHWHGISLKLGGNLFVHGDCTHRRMDASGLSKYRRGWEQDKPRHPIFGHGYRLADRMGITWLFHRIHFPRKRTIGRLLWYLDHSHSGWRETTRNCYFGHTHLPFSGLAEGLVLFHNTGSAISSSSFSPLSFPLAVVAPEPERRLDPE